MACRPLVAAGSQFNDYIKWLQAVPQLLPSSSENDPKAFLFSSRYHSTCLRILDPSCYMPNHHVLCLFPALSLSDFQDIINIFSGPLKNTYPLKNSGLDSRNGTEVISSDFTSTLEILVLKFTWLHNPLRHTSTAMENKQLPSPQIEKTEVKKWVIK